MLFNDTYKTVGGISQGYEIKFDHLQMNEVMKIIKDEDLKIQNQLFDTICIMQLEVRNSVHERVIDRLKNIRNINLKNISSPEN